MLFLFENPSKFSLLQHSLTFLFNVPLSPSLFLIQNLLSLTYTVLPHLPATLQLPRYSLTSLTLSSPLLPLLQMNFLLLATSISTSTSRLIRSLLSSLLPSHQLTSHNMLISQHISITIRLTLSLPLRHLPCHLVSHTLCLLPLITTPYSLVSMSHRLLARLLPSTTFGD